MKDVRREKISSREEMIGLIMFSAKEVGDVTLERG